MSNFNFNTALSNPFSRRFCIIWIPAADLLCQMYFDYMSYLELEAINIKYLKDKSVLFPTYEIQI